jgi:hypothetical protein
LGFLKGVFGDTFWSEHQAGGKVQKYGYFLPLGNAILIFLNFPLDIGLKLWLFKYHG